MKPGLARQILGSRRSRADVHGRYENLSIVAGSVNSLAELECLLCMTAVGQRSASTGTLDCDTVDLAYMLREMQSHPRAVGRS